MPILFADDESLSDFIPVWNRQMTDPAEIEKHRPECDKCGKKVNRRDDLDLCCCRWAGDERFKCEACLNDHDCLLASGHQAELFPEEDPDFPF